MKREHHERKDRTAKRSDRKEERQKAECCIENKFHTPLLCWKLDSAVQLLALPQQCGACSSAYITTQTQREKMEEVCVRWEEFGANLSDMGNTRNNRYTQIFHLFLYLFNFQSGRRQGNVSLFSSRSIQVEINHRPHLSTVLTARTSDYI